jgi:hypothetical protein
MANSGIKKVQINTRERAASDDVNSIQGNIALSLMETWRLLYAAPRTTSGAGASNLVEEAQPVTTDAFALQSVIPGGLLVDPQVTHLLVDPGMLMCILTPGADESAMVMARSDGVTSSTALPFVANGGGGPRWDLVECRPRVTTTTQSKDIFDPTTQQFVPTSVNKIIETDLEFRHTQGTAGSPAAAPVPTAGWQPLCAVWVPNTATDFDDCEVFDVRPTVEGMADPGFLRRGNDSGFQQNVTSEYLVQSTATGSSFMGGSNNSRIFFPGMATSQHNPASFGSNAPRGYNVSGILQRTNPGDPPVDSPTQPYGPPVDLTAGVTAVGVTGDYMESGVTFQWDTWYPVKLVFPFGLARFRRFSPYRINGRRWPIELPGLVSIGDWADSAIEPGQGLTGEVPAAYDTAATQYAAVFVGWVRSAGSGGFWPGDEIFRTAISKGGWYYPIDGVDVTQEIRPDSATTSSNVWDPASFIGQTSDIPRAADIFGDFALRTDQSWTTGQHARLDFTLDTDFGYSVNDYRREVPFIVMTEADGQKIATHEVFLPVKYYKTGGSGIVATETTANALDPVTTNSYLKISRFRMY